MQDLFNKFGKRTKMRLIVFVEVGVTVVYFFVVVVVVTDRQTD